MKVALVALVGAAADWVGAFAGICVGVLAGAVVGVRVAGAWVAGAPGCVVGSTDAADAGALDGALDATYGEVAGASGTDGSLEPRGETNGGRAARTEADFKPSNATIAVIVPSVARTARFMAATRVS
jgi:hypothetical protein